MRVGARRSASNGRQPARPRDPMSFPYNLARNGPAVARGHREANGIGGRDASQGVAALCRSNVSVHDLAVEAVLRHDREAAFHAVACCPVTSAVLSLPKIREMFEEMWEAEEQFLGWFDKRRTEPIPETFEE